MDLPIFNFDQLRDDPNYKKEMAPVLVQQLKETGFLLVEINDEDAKITSVASNTSRKFFEENETPQKWLHALRPEGLGFSYFGGKQTRQAFTVCLPPKGFPFPWPETPSDFEPHITTYFNLQQKIGTELLRTIELERQQELSKYLDSPDFDDYSSSTLFVRFYQSETVKQKEEPQAPVTKENFWPKDHTREHTDSGILTMKPLSEIAALQVLRWSNLEWMDAEMPQAKSASNLVVVLAGEELAFLTDGFFKASIHRVAFQSTDTRVSLPFQLRGDRRKFPNCEPKPNTSLKMISLLWPGAQSQQPEPIVS